MALTRVFVSYSHEDSRWLDKEYEYCLIPWLERVLRQDVEFWYDRAGIGPGEVFRHRIVEEIDRADVAIVLVSQAFLASEFIQEVELPRIAARAERGELAVIPILVEPCTWEEIDFLGSRQMIPGRPTPLIDYTENRRQWSHARHEIYQAVMNRITKPTPPPEPGEDLEELAGEDMPAYAEPAEFADEAEPELAESADAIEAEETPPPEDAFRASDWGMAEEDSEF